MVWPTTTHTFMSEQHANNFPKLHNAMWPGLVGKGSPGAEPAIDLDTMLDLTSRAEVDGIKFDGVDIFLFEPHVNIDIDEDGLKRLADKILSRGFVVGSVVAPVWPPTGGGSAMGTDEDRKRFVEQVRKACRIGSRLRELGARPYGVIRIDSASGVDDWSKDPTGNQKKIARTFADACDVAEQYGERLAAEGEICWGGMHSWKKMIDLLERVNRPDRLGFQADMAHTLLYVMGYNEPEDAILPQDWDWSDPAGLDAALRILTNALRPWTLDFHVAQNDATVHGSGTHDKTGHHCLATDPNGKLDIPRHSAFWLRGKDGAPTKAFRHICWDGCMFSNETMMKQETWNDILRAMISVRDAHGWTESAVPEIPETKQPRTPVARLKPRSAKARPLARQKTKRKTASASAKAPKAARPAARKPVSRKVVVAKRNPKKSRAKLQGVTRRAKPLAKKKSGKGRR
jgi:sugar phosphate isomerase/epimerase